MNNQWCETRENQIEYRLNPQTKIHFQEIQNAYKFGIGKHTMHKIVIMNESFHPILFILFFVLAWLAMQMVILIINLFAFIWWINGIIMDIAVQGISMLETSFLSWNCRNNHTTIQPIQKYYSFIQLNTQYSTHILISTYYY